MKETWQALNFSKSLLEPLAGFLKKMLNFRNQNWKKEYLPTVLQLIAINFDWNLSTVDKFL